MNISPKNCTVYNIQTMELTTLPFSDALQSFSENRLHWLQMDFKASVRRVISTQRQKQTVTLPPLTTSKDIQTAQEAVTKVMDESKERRSDLEAEFDKLTKNTTSSESHIRLAELMETLSQIYKEVDEAIYINTKLAERSVEVYDPEEGTCLRYNLQDALTQTAKALDIIENDMEPHQARLIERENKTPTIPLPNLDLVEDYEDAIDDFSDLLEKTEEERKKVLKDYDAFVSSASKAPASSTRLINVISAVSNNNKVIDECTYIVTRLESELAALKKQKRRR